MSDTDNAEPTSPQVPSEDPRNTNEPTLPQTPLPGGFPTPPASSAPKPVRSEESRPGSGGAEGGALPPPGYVATPKPPAPVFSATPTQGGGGPASPPPHGVEGPPNYGPPNQGPPNYGPPNYGPPNYGPPNYGPPNQGPPNYGPPNQGPPNYGPPNYGPPPGGGWSGDGGGAGRPTPVRKKSNASTYIILGIGLALMIGFVLFCVMCSSAMSGAGGLGGGFGGISGSTNLRESFVAGDADASDKIVLIPIDGVIMDASQGGGFGPPTPNMVTLTKLRLRQAVESKAKAIILQVNSPGGGVTASEMIYREIKRVKSEHGIPIIALMKDVAASGGYYVSAPADHIVAAPSTITASIGVVLSHYDLTGLVTEKLGVKVEPFKSAQQKDILSMFREPTEKERAHIQSIVNLMYDRFVEIVVDGRRHKGVTEESVRALESTILIGSQALEKNLVDELGFIEEAIAAAKMKAGLSRAAVVRFDPPLSFLETLMSPQAKGPGERLAERISGQSQTTPLLYLWSGF